MASFPEKVTGDNFHPPSHIMLSLPQCLSSVNIFLLRLLPLDGKHNFGNWSGLIEIR